METCYSVQSAHVHVHVHVATCILPIIVAIHIVINCGTGFIPCSTCTCIYLVNIACTVCRISQRSGGKSLRMFPGPKFTWEKRDVTLGCLAVISMRPLLKSLFRKGCRLLLHLYYKLYSSCLYLAHSSVSTSLQFLLPD